MQDFIDITNFHKTFAKFVKERNWEQHHNPKNIAMALTVEAAELLEIFQWLTVEESQNVKNNLAIKEKVSHELADIMIYLMHLAAQTNINLQHAIIEKMKLNSQKYPVKTKTDCCEE